MHSMLCSAQTHLTCRRDRWCRGSGQHSLRSMHPVNDIQISTSVGWLGIHTLSLMLDSFMLAHILVLSFDALY